MQQKKKFACQRTCFQISCKIKMSVLVYEEENASFHSFVEPQYLLEDLDEEISTLLDNFEANESLKYIAKFVAQKLKKK